MRYAKVLPLPVCAWSTTSRFLKNASAARRCTAVGYRNPSCSARAQSHSAIPSARQSRISPAGSPDAPWSALSRSLSFAARP